MVEILISVDGFCNKGDIGVISEVNYGGIDELVLVEFKIPPFDQNNYPLFLSEVREAK
jgi:hypothetical protein